MAKKKSRRAKRPSTFYHKSQWVETTYDRDGQEVLLPLRARAVARKNKVRGESEFLTKDGWVMYKVFPWCPLRFSPKGEVLDTLAISVADAIIEYFEEKDPAALEKMLQEAPVVPSPE